MATGFITGRRIAVCASAFLWAAGTVIVSTPTAGATICGAVGGRHVTVTGCSDPFSELNDTLYAPPPAYYPPPPPPPPVYYPPPPPNIQVCGTVGRRVTVTGCT
jgi:hypothetical protein